MQNVLPFCRPLFGALARPHGGLADRSPPVPHRSAAGERGRPTPEGLHRDGVDYVLVLLVDRRNIASGMTTIHALDGRTLGHFTLTDPFDAALVDDTRVAHGVTPVERSTGGSQPALPSRLSLRGDASRLVRRPETRSMHSAHLNPSRRTPFSAIALAAEMDTVMY